MNVPAMRRYESLRYVIGVGRSRRRPGEPSDPELTRINALPPAQMTRRLGIERGSTDKNWDDFVARKVVPADVLAAIKDSVSF
jgi:hypothetical protein